MRRRLLPGEEKEVPPEEEKTKKKHLLTWLLSLFQTSANKYVIVAVLFFLVLASFIWGAIKNRDGSPPTSNKDVQIMGRQSKSKANMGLVVYGTALKQDKTAGLVSEALHAGFRHIATGSVHHLKYNESAVGIGWTTAAKDIGLAREDLFIQTMFVPVGNKDWVEWQYDGIGKQNSIAEQVNSSVHSSLSSLQTSYLDAVLYHNFRNKLDSAEQVLEAWRVLERFVDCGIIRYLGITNCHDIPFLEDLYAKARIKPTILQNRFHANRQFGMPLGPFLKEKQIKSQLFWILNGNGGTLQKGVVKKLAQKFNLTSQTFMYAFLMSLGDTPLIGTTQRHHMNQDMAVEKRFATFGRHAIFNESEHGVNAMQEFSDALGRPNLMSALNKY
mmetsp:Transcript_13925/g.19501  ORF Transcript_13925/g.19501 Transcript_13925/m.19501 type:complete len:386 (+) Transcript_13925:62-1219(+)